VTTKYLGKFQSSRAITRPKIVGPERNVNLICNSSLYTHKPNIKSISQSIAKKMVATVLFRNYGLRQHYIPRPLGGDITIKHLLTTELKFHSTPSVLPGYYRIRWWKQCVDTLYSTCKQRPYLIYKLTNNNTYYISCTFSANYRQLEYKCMRAPLAVDSIQLIRFYHVS